MPDFAILLKALSVAGALGGNADNAAANSLRHSESGLRSRVMHERPLDTPYWRTPVPGLPVARALARYGERSWETKNMRPTEKMVLQTLMHIGPFSAARSPRDIERTLKKARLFLDDVALLKCKNGLTKDAGFLVDHYNLVLSSKLSSFEVDRMEIAVYDTVMNIQKICL